MASLSAASLKIAKLFPPNRLMVTFMTISFPTISGPASGKATVVEYDDSSPLQEPIPSESFYVRRAYNSLFCSVSVCIFLAYQLLYHSTWDGSPTLTRAPHVFVISPTTQMDPTLCIFALALIAGNGTMRAALRKMVTYPKSRLTSVCKGSWTFHRRAPI